ncbi:serine/threonine protein kinase [Roseimicrobium gellanilyticum]|uniref:Serine/threonine protein kinase n=2 Tax=Roseimicrobium gellanilyticum TaxID=748857 RepID=A0A366H3D1_9BACT|nr:serine/threonine protein kinase [Roseimicrobium gellanilyticum]
MGVTYLAEDTNLKVRVALKVIRPQLLGDAEVGQRFQREAQAAARLRHPNVAGVYHLGMVDNTFFYAMEFVEGDTVKDRVQRGGPMPIKEALEVTLQVCEALGAAEKHKMVHRDIKPANIMLEPVEDDILRVKLIDFGLAKPLHAEAQNSMALQTQAGIFLGTPVFASPEQVQDVPPDSRSDFYALGLTLWFMLEGRTPFEGSLHKVLFDQVHTAPPLGRLLWVPAEVRDLLGKMLEKEPANRPQTAKELRQKIHDCLRALATSGTSYTEWQQRFQVEGKPYAKPWGMIYEGQDTLSGAVRLHLLRHDRFSDPKALQGVIGDARRAIDIHHPNILRHLTVFPTSGGQGAGWMVVTEHPGNQTLLDHLRKVKQMPLAETIAIVERLASAIDTCLASDLITADLDPAGIFLKQVPRTEIHPLTQTATATSTSTSITSPTTETFEVVPKLSPINYAILTTLRPADETAIGLTQGPFRTEATTPQELVQRLALLAYQCLGGAVPSTWSRVPRFIPLANLTQRQNDTLRTALVDTAWTRAADFVEAFQQTKATPRRTDDTSRITTSSEATVMLTSWRMLADLAAGDSSEFSTEHANEFTGKIEKQEAPVDAAPDTPEESKSSAPEAASQVPAPAETSGEPSEGATATPEASVTPESASVLDSTLGREQTQTWSRVEGSTESTAVEPPAATQSTVAEAQGAATARTATQTLSPNETETIILPSRTAQLPVTSAPPEIREEPTVAKEIASDSEAGDSGATFSAPEISESAIHTESSVEARADAATASAPVAEEPSVNTTEELEAEAAPATSTSSILDVPAEDDAQSSPLTSGVSDRDAGISSSISAPETDARRDTSTAASFTGSESPPPAPPAIVPLTPRPTTATSAVPLPPPARPQHLTSSPSSKALQAGTSRPSSLPGWLLPGVAALVVVILIASIAVWMNDDTDEPEVPDSPPVVVNPPPPPPPVGPTLTELLTTAGDAVTAGNLAALDEALGKIREKYPNQTWESDAAANAFRDKVFRAYHAGKLGDGTEAARKYHDVLIGATLAKESDIPLLKQICTDLSSTEDAGRAEPFEMALLNSLAADPSRNEQRIEEALSLVKKRPNSTVAELARGILSKELEESVDYLEQVPRDPSQVEYLKNALTVLMPRMQEIAEAGVAEAYYILGDKAHKEDKPTLAERNFELAADLGHAPSMRRYGNARTNTVGDRPADMNEAAYYLRLASAQNDLRAKVFLADIYLPAEPTESLPWRGPEAEKLLIEAIKGGVPEADYLYGAMLMDFKPDDAKQPFAQELKGKERWDKVVEHLQKAEAGKVSRAYPALAAALLWHPYKKDIAGAKQTLEKGVQLDPPNPFCMLLLSDLISGHPANNGVRPFTADQIAAAGIYAEPARSGQLRNKAIELLIIAAKKNQADAVQWCEKNGVPYKN